MPCDSISVQLPDGGTVAVACVRHPRARRLKLTVTARGIRLTLPPRASRASGVQFVWQQRDWLAAQRDAHQPAVAALVPHQTTCLPLRGEPLPLVWMPGRYVDVRLETSSIQFHVPAAACQTALIRALRDFYLTQARADIARWLPAYLPALPRPPARIRLRMMVSQWGSLTANDTLSLDLALVLAAPAAFEYVLVHELCHLIQRNHSPRFWAEVEIRCPDWRAARDGLRDHGRQVKAQLHALLHPAITPVRA